MSNELNTVQALADALDDLINWMPRVEPAKGQQAQVDESIEKACAALAAGRALLSQMKEPAAAQGEPRFFMDHGVWHDRETGQHLYTEDQHSDALRAATDGAWAALEALGVKRDGWITLPEAIRSLYAAPPVRTGPQGDARDAARFDWYFSAKPKGDWLMTYLTGMEAGWTTDEWRAAIDAAIGKMAEKPSGVDSPDGAKHD